MGRCTFRITFATLLILFNFERIESQFATEPGDVTIVSPAVVSLQCEISSLPLTESPRWHRYIGTPPTRAEIWNGYQNRFFITGDRNAGVYNLFINYTRTSDTGLYSCSYGGASTTNATLTVLPTSWLPLCQKFPTDQTVSAGNTVDLLCTSTGSSFTNLRWLKNDEHIVAGAINRNESTVVIAHTDVIPNEGTTTFTCEASVPGMVQTCSLGPYPDMNNSSISGIIPFIVVGLLSLVVILLFLIVIFIMFRHRQCRFCRRQLPDPQTVLDADAIAAGRGFPVFTIEDEDAEEAVDATTMREKQPDVVPVSYHKDNLSPKSRNSTLRENKEGSSPTKKHAENEKLRPTELRKIKKKRTPSSSSQVDNIDSHLETRDRREFDTPSQLSNELNITPRSPSTTLVFSTPDNALPGPSTSTETSNINDLDASIGRKNRFTKKRDSKKSSSSTTPPTSPTRSTPHASDTGQSDDKVIYAELDFSRNIGMNILGDEQL